MLDQVQIKKKKKNLGVWFDRYASTLFWPGSLPLWRKPSLLGARAFVSHKIDEQSHPAAFLRLHASEDLVRFNLAHLPAWLPHFLSQVFVFQMTKWQNDNKSVPESLAGHLLLCLRRCLGNPGDTGKKVKCGKMRENATSGVDPQKKSNCGPFISNRSELTDGRWAVKLLTIK